MRAEWTEAEEGTLAAMSDRGFTASEIARVMQRSVHAVEKRRAALRLARNPIAREWSTAEDQRIVQLRQQGWTTGEIARVLPGRTDGAVKHRVQYLRDVRHGAAPTDFIPVTDEERADRHLQAILKANPNGFLAWSEKRVGVRGSAPCAPAFYPMQAA